MRGDSIMSDHSQFETGFKSLALTKLDFKLKFEIQLCRHNVHHTTRVALSPQSLFCGCKRLLLLAD